MRYRVHITKQHPAWDERDGFTYEVEAKDKAQAIRYARRMSDDDGLTGPGQGRAWFRAEPIEE